MKLDVLSRNFFSSVNSTSFRNEKILLLKCRKRINDHLCRFHAFLISKSFRFTFAIFLSNEKAIYYVCINKFLPLFLFSSERPFFCS